MLVLEHFLVSKWAFTWFLAAFFLLFIRIVDGKDGERYLMEGMSV
jgi:hypothetical protein